MFKECIWQTKVNSEQETSELIRNRLYTLKVPYCLYLEGDVGTGKTYVCKQISKFFNVDNVTSSSFLYYNIYNSHVRIIHVDYYNSLDTEEFFYTNVYEEINNHTVVLNEWSPSYFLLDIPQYVLNLKIVEALKREFTFFRLT